MSQNKMISDFTKGSIPRQMLRFAVPFMISNAMQVLYALVDMVVVGQMVGSAGLSAVSTASQVFTFATMLCLGYCTGGQVLISQLIGANRKEALNRTIGTLFTVILALSLLVTALGLVLHRWVLRVLNTPAESYGMAVEYMLVCSSGMVFSYGYNMVTAVLRGMGDARHPFIFILIASVLNLCLDLLFVGIFHWGVGGAALATIIGQAVSFIYALVFLYRRKNDFCFDFKLASLKPDKEILKKLTSLGVPFALQSCAINISMMFVNSLVNRVGVNASAVFGVGIKIDDVVNKITQGISYAVSSMVGQNVAAQKPDRVKKTVLWGWIYGLVAYAVFTVFYLAIPEKLFGLFTKDPEVIKLAPVFVSGLVWSFPAMVLMRGTTGLVQGVGNAKLGLALAFLDGFALRIACSYLIGITMGYGLYGFFLGFALATYGTAIPGTIYFLTGAWKRYRLISDQTKKAA